MDLGLPRPPIFANRDRNHEVRVAVAALMREPHAARKMPIVRLVEDDFDGVYDDRPAQAAAAA